MAFLAFLFLDELSRDFVSELKSEYGDDWLRTVETVSFSLIIIIIIIAHLS